MSDQAKLGGIFTLFIVEALARAVEFYRDTLGFDVRLSVPGDEPFFAIVGRQQAQILLKQIGPEVGPQPNPSRHPRARWDAFVSVEDPDALWSEYQDRGVDFPERFKDREDGLRGFAIRDIDGYFIILRTADMRTRHRHAAGDGAEGFGIHMRVHRRVACRVGRVHSLSAAAPRYA